MLCDAHLMETVLRNLLYNALRYARQEIRVSFTIEPDSRYRLCVEDDGPGIPEADRQRVFGSFVQLDHAGKHKAGSASGWRSSSASSSGMVAPRRWMSRHLVEPASVWGGVGWRGV